MSDDGQAETPELQNLELQSESSVFRAEYERELGQWLRRRLGLLCLVYASFEVLSTTVMILFSVAAGGDRPDAATGSPSAIAAPAAVGVAAGETTGASSAREPAARGESGGVARDAAESGSDGGRSGAVDGVGVASDASWPEAAWAEFRRDALPFTPTNGSAATTAADAAPATGGTVPVVSPYEAFTRLLERRRVAQPGEAPASDGGPTDGPREWSTPAMAPWAQRPFPNAAFPTVGPSDAPRPSTVRRARTAEAPPRADESTAALGEWTIPWWIWAIVAAPIFGVLAWFGLVVRPRLETRGALVAAASRMILALGFLNFAFECAILLANPEVPVTPLTSIFFWHLTASLFLPWSWRESLRPILPLLAAWLLLRLGLAVGDGGWGSLVATVIALPFLFAPALILCYARLRWHRNRFKSGFVGRRFLAMRREFLHARAIHESLFPKPISEDWIRFDFSYRPAADIGGDFVHAWIDPSGRFHLAIIDVTGHGLASAMSVARIHGEIERLRDEHPDEGPARILARLNRYFHRLLARHSLFATGILMTVDPTTGELRYASAGHPPIFLRSRGALRELESTTFMLGAVDGEMFGEEEVVVPLEERDTLILFTDGAYDARSPRGERFGLDRLREILRRPNPPVRWSQYLVRLVETFEAGLPEDDLLVAEVTFTQRRSVWSSVTGDEPPMPAPAAVRERAAPVARPAGPSAADVEPAGAGAVA